MKTKHPALELPIRSKLNMLDDMIQIIHCLHTGKRKEAEKWMDDLKVRALFLDESIQHKVLIFCEQILFQYDYDPWHKVTREVQAAADELIETMGFFDKPNG